MVCESISVKLLHILKKPFTLDLGSQPWLPVKITWAGGQEALLKSQCPGHTLDQLHQNLCGRDSDIQIIENNPKHPHIFLSTFALLSLLERYNGSKSDSAGRYPGKKCINKRQGWLYKCLAQSEMKMHGYA